MDQVSISAETHCARCGAPMSTSIEGLCSACLLRLAMVEEPIPADALENLPRLESGSGVNGQRIGNYELLDEISRGGMGIVYRARQVNAGRKVAVKVMLPQLLPITGMRERFRREIEAVAQLDHPGILPIYEVGEHAGLPYFSMKLAENGGLDRRLASLAGEWRQIAALVASVAHAVDHAHGRGILHRDLKPANILFVQDTPLVADFGLAKLRVVESGLTIPASALGSPNYMAPEQVSAEFGDVGPGTDVYGLGAILYELLVTRPPIAGTDALETLRLVSAQQPIPCREIRDDVPPGLDAIALKCLAKHPAQRYASARELALDLEGWLNTGVASEALEHPRKIRNRAFFLGFAAVAFIVAAVFFIRPATQGAGTEAQALAAVAPRTLSVAPFRQVDATATADVGMVIREGLVRELRGIESLNVVALDADAARVNGDEEALGAPVTDLRLEGDLERMNEQIRVRARLMDGPTGLALWEGEVTRPPAEAARIPEQLAELIGVQIRSDSRELAWAQFQADNATRDAEAYKSYLRARGLIRWRRVETLREAARLLRAAIARDASFAQAHSALANVYTRWPPPSPPEGDHWTLALQFAQSALALDPTLGEPHAVIGHYYTDRAQPAEAEPHLRKALEANPRDPVSLHFYAVHMNSVGKLGEALRAEQRSVALDGSNQETLVWLAKFTTRAGDREEALRLWRQADALGAQGPLCAAISRLDLGQSEPLASYYREKFGGTGAAQQTQNSQVLLAGVLDASKRGPALEWLRAAEPHIDPAFAITHYALLGDADDAYRIAAKFELRDDFWYLYQIVNIWATRTASLRRDPRFGALLERWGYVDYWKRFGASELCELRKDSAVCR